MVTELKDIDSSAIHEKSESWGSSKILLKNSKAEIGLFKVAPGKSMNMHTHATDELIYVLTGRASFEDEEGGRDVQEGAAVFVPESRSHKALNKGSKDYWCLYIVSDLEP